MTIPAVVPVQSEADFLVQAITKEAYQGENAQIGRLPVTHLPGLGLTLACGGLGKVQFRVQTQYLLDMCSDWDLVLCADAAGALVDWLAVGDVLVATETVEHDIRNQFGEPLLPSFLGDAAAVAEPRSLAPLCPSFQVHVGPVARGDEDVVDCDRRRTLHERTGAVAVAWEGAGGARACRFSGIPFVEIRGITDRADSDAALDFEKNLRGAMANVALLLVRWLHRRVTP